MGTHLFNKLYQQAYEREHTIVVHAQQLWNTYEGDDPWFARDLPMLGRLARNLEAGYVQFSRDLESLAHRNGMRVNNWPSFCGICGQPTCPGAVPQPVSMPGLIGAALIAHILKGPPPGGKGT